MAPRLLLAGASSKFLPTVTTVGDRQVPEMTLPPHPTSPTLPRPKGRPDNSELSMRPWKDAEQHNSAAGESHTPTTNWSLCSIVFNAAWSWLGLQKHAKGPMFLIGVPQTTLYFHLFRVKWQAFRILKNVFFWDVTPYGSCKNRPFRRNLAPPSSRWQESVN
jgi:hypothetical protein